MVSRMASNSSFKSVPGCSAEVEAVPALALV